MTQERLEALKKLDADISYTESIITELKCAEGLCICGYDNSEVRTKYLIDTLGEDADLRTLITKINLQNSRKNLRRRNDGQILCRKPA